VVFLEKLTVYEVSPVLLGAGIGTGTEIIKELDPPDPPAGSDSGGGDEGQTGNGEPSGVPPQVIGQGIAIDLLDLDLV